MSAAFIFSCLLEAHVPTLRAGGPPLTEFGGLPAQIECDRQVEQCNFTVYLTRNGVKEAMPGVVVKAGETTTVGEIEMRCPEAPPQPDWAQMPMTTTTITP